MPRHYVIASRTSELAVKQLHIMRDTLAQHIQAVSAGDTLGTTVITTGGDHNQSQALFLLAGKDLWTKELNVKLLDKSADMVVHSYKDVPTTVPDGFEIAGVLEREDPVDSLVVRLGLPWKTLEDLPAGSVVGTSSVRRVAQLKRAFPKLAFKDVRGNLNTRIKKLDAEDSPYAALVLAKAGLLRLGWKDRISSDLTPPTLLYAVSQGALAIQIRCDDPEARALCRAITHWQTEWRCAAERAFLRVLEGGCSVPVGVDSHWTENPGSVNSGVLKITGAVTSLAGDQHIQHTLEEPADSLEAVEAIGAKLANILIKNGAKEILDDLTKERVRRIGELKTEEERQKIEAAIAA